MAAGPTPRCFGLRPAITQRVRMREILETRPLAAQSCLDIRVLSQHSGEESSKRFARQSWNEVSFRCESLRNQRECVTIVRRTIMKRKTIAKPRYRR